MAAGSAPAAVVELMGIAVEKPRRFNSKVSKRRGTSTTEGYEDESASEEAIDYGLDTPWALSPFAQYVWPHPIYALSIESPADIGLP